MFKFLLKYLLFLGLLFNQYKVYSSSTEWQDSTFGTNGIVTNTLENNASINSFALQSNDKIIAAGNLEDEIYLIRYNFDGSLDSGFNSIGSTATSIGTRASLNSVTIDNGNILVAGYAIINNSSNIILCQYTSSGQLDSGFGTGGIVSQSVGDGSMATSIATTTNQAIIVAGLTMNNGMQNSLLTKFDLAGEIDTTFGSNGNVIVNSGIHNFINSIAIDFNDKIIAGGNRLTNSDSNFFIFRCNSNGTLDDTFGTNGIVTTIIDNFSVVNSIAIDQTGNIIAAGISQDSSSNTYNLIIAKYNPDGSLDDVFGTNGIVKIPYNKPSQLQSVKIDSNNKVIAAGSTENSSILIRLNSDGTLDDTFGINGILSQTFNDTVSSESLLLQGDSKIIVGGTYSNDLFLIKYKPNNDVYINNPVNNAIFNDTDTVEVNGKSSFASSQIDAFIDNLSTPFTSVISDSSGNWDAGTSANLSDGSHIVYAQLSGSAATQDAKAFTIKTKTNLDHLLLSGNIIGTPVSIDDTGNLQIPTNSLTTFISSSNAATFTLGAGTTGQIKIIYFSSGSGSVAISSNLANASSLSLSSIGQSALLIFNGTAWVIISTTGTIS